MSTCRFTVFSIINLVIKTFNHGRKENEKIGSKKDVVANLSDPQMGALRGGDYSAILKSIWEVTKSVLDSYATGNIATQWGNSCVTCQGQNTCNDTCNNTCAATCGDQATCANTCECPTYNDLSTCPHNPGDGCV